MNQLGLKLLQTRETNEAEVKHLKRVGCGMCDGEGYKKRSQVPITPQDKKQTWVELGNSFSPYLEGKRVVPTVFPPLMGHRCSGNN
ncbi:hypothetical protein CEXT_463971 [Caerostris extrusa]|uniref:Uncharacterized protein n=1 Tax=Caerostris extrusa TaxID=172846 RepID=A0AAV4M524_CAEEX|nr:hypothetical protein CEXT_463971 [Caerostris extrusa]